MDSPKETTSIRSLQLVSKSLIDSEDIPATSTTTLSPFRSHSTHLKFLESVGSSHRSNSNNFRRDPLLYTFLSANHDDQIPSAIINLRACGPVVGHDTLDEAMALLNIKKQGDERINQSEHQFGPNEELRRTICAVCVPILCRDQITTNHVRFHVRFDVTTGSFPFFIDLPSVMAIKAPLCL